MDAAPSAGLESERDKVQERNEEHDRRDPASDDRGLEHVAALEEIRDIAAVELVGQSCERGRANHIQDEADYDPDQVREDAPERAVAEELETKLEDDCGLALAGIGVGERAGKSAGRATLGTQATTAKITKSQRASMMAAPTIPSSREGDAQPAERWIADGR